MLLAENDNVAVATRHCFIIISLCPHPSGNRGVCALPALGIEKRAKFVEMIDCKDCRLTRDLEQFFDEEFVGAETRVLVR